MVSTNTEGKGRAPLNWSPRFSPCPFCCFQLRRQKAPVEMPLLGSKPLRPSISLMLTEKSHPHATSQGYDLTPGYPSDPVSFLPSLSFILLQPQFAHCRSPNVPGLVPPRGLRACHSHAESLSPRSSRFLQGVTQMAPFQ